MLQDIAILTGGTVISRKWVDTLEGATLEDLGHAKKVHLTKDNTTIVDGAGQGDEIEGSYQADQAEIEDTSSDYDREKLQERLAKLAGGVAVINVGAATEIGNEGEESSRRRRSSTRLRAAAEEGIVPGGGVALLRSRRHRKPHR